MRKQIERRPSAPSTILCYINRHVSLDCLLALLQSGPRLAVRKPGIAPDFDQSERVLPKVRERETLHVAPHVRQIPREASAIEQHAARRTGDARVRDYIVSGAGDTFWETLKAHSGTCRSEREI